MTGSDILTMACNLLAETSGDSVTVADLRARAPYILAAFCGEARVIDKRYREAFSLGTQPMFDRTHLDLSKAFPLCDRLAPTAAMYVASLLIADENPELSAIFSERCRDSLSSVYCEIPATIQSIKNVYN